MEVDVSVKKGEEVTVTTQKRSCEERANLGSAERAFPGMKDDFISSHLISCLLASSPMQSRSVISSDE